MLLKLLVTWSILDVARRCHLLTIQNLSHRSLVFEASYIMTICMIAHRPANMLQQGLLCGWVIVDLTDHLRKYVFSIFLDGLRGAVAKLLHQFLK